MTLQALGWANLRIVSSGRNKGTGAAAVLFADADYSTPIDELDSTRAPTW